MIIEIDFNKKKYIVDDEKLLGTDLITGHILFYRKKLFTGNYRRPKYSGYEDYIVEIINESYGQSTGQHTFTLKVLLPLDKSNFKPIGSKILVKGRNLYPNCVVLIEPEDELERRIEKHDRAFYAKLNKNYNFIYYDMNDDDNLYSD